MTAWRRLDVSALPVTVDPVPGEAADSYAERVAAANHLAAATLLPDSTVLGSVGRVRHAAATGTPDRSAAVPRRQGWEPGAITQACPSCLAADGAWRRAWYDPMITACLTHGCYLIAECPGCGRRLKDTQHRILRSAGVGTRCDNALSSGLGPRCSTDLAHIEPSRAPGAVLEQQTRLREDTSAVRMLGEPVTAASYRDSVRNLAVLLLHITTATPAAPEAFRLEETERSTRRWWLHPPRAPVSRAAVLVAADRILTAGSLDAAAQQFMPWFDAIPPVWEGRVSWAADHTHADPTLTRLLLAASTPRQRLSHRLPHEPALRLQPEWIPQRLPARLQHLAAGCGLSASTARGFASLCLAKAQLTTGSWEHAAALLGLPGQVGPDLARTASAHLAVNTGTWIDHLRHVVHQLAADRVDYRRSERVVRHLDSAAQEELLLALQEARPGTRSSSRDLVWHWVWDHWAAGHPAATPALVTATRAGRARYAQFRDSLRPRHEQVLLAVIARDSSRTVVDR